MILMWFLSLRSLQLRKFLKDTVKNGYYRVIYLCAIIITII